MAFESQVTSLVEAAGQLGNEEPILKGVATLARGAVSGLALVFSVVSWARSRIRARRERREAKAFEARKGHAWRCHEEACERDRACRELEQRGFVSERDINVIRKALGLPPLGSFPLHIPGHEDEVLSPSLPCVATLQPIAAASPAKSPESVAVSVNAPQGATVRVEVGQAAASRAASLPSSAVVGANVCDAVPASPQGMWRTPDGSPISFAELQAALAKARDVLNGRRNTA